ncbi:acetyl-CoA carboxylase biotin carboxyl carrier protein subunit [Bacillus tianshenii]|uniref:acetyl-CoA carboxylase biotin carboxyl carrier protein subunit n=1 Tax=Sutcliffiella tianshenii TaxID=1463404 RepID=UPI001CD55B53|nr:acetyl-CoA carboxylase biotin carboxyl carrier protein subunit [Bacillus tianshenii]MCA1322310.1 acetyl-CoA carboxylase biotin carboxyl carrier protein subunit [Bacillus tianshenii]
MKKIEASMAGTIWKILVEVGDEVTAGQTVIILESMKMEIPLEAAVDGKVASINTAEGDFVNDGDVLLELE